MAPKLRVGIAGVGFIGKLHAEHFAANEHVELVGIADVDLDRGRYVADVLGCPSYTEPTELLGKIDAVSIAVPTVKHREVAELFLREGVHMLMEKPLAATVADAEVLVEMAHQNSAKLLVGHQERFNSAIMEIAHRIDRPEFIEANRHGKFAGRGGDVDVITDLMIHDIDLVLAMINAPVKSVSALGASVITSHVDIANARIEFENHAVANVTASRVANDRIRNFKIYMRQQLLELDLLDQSILLTNRSYDPEDRFSHSTSTQQIDTVPALTLKNEIDHFVEIVRNGGEPFVSGEDAVLALRVAQMVREQIDQH